MVDTKTTKASLSDYYFNGFAPNNQIYAYLWAAKNILGLEIAGFIIDAVQTGVHFTRFNRSVYNVPTDLIHEWYKDAMHTLDVSTNYFNKQYYPADFTACNNYGGCRFKEYESEIHAIEDVLKLSKAMTLKNRVAGVPFGGGKAVIIKNKQNNKEHLELFATFINHLDGAYLSAQDIGISLTDIRIVSQLSEHVLDNVDPGPYTAKGIYYALRSVKDHYFNGNNEDILIQ